MSKTKGRVTLPSESDFLDETKELLERWGADAIRDSDGTKIEPGSLHQIHSLDRGKNWRKSCHYGLHR